MNTFIIIDGSYPHILALDRCKNCLVKPPIRWGSALNAVSESCWHSHFALFHYGHFKGHPCHNVNAIVVTSGYDGTFATSNRLPCYFCQSWQDFPSMSSILPAWDFFQHQFLLPCNQVGPSSPWLRLHQGPFPWLCCVESRNSMRHWLRFFRKYPTFGRVFRLQVFGVPNASHEWNYSS